MAYVATPLRCIPYNRPRTAINTITTVDLPTARPTATESDLIGEVVGLGAALDQVDNNTSRTRIFKPMTFLNRMNDKYHREDERLRTYENWRLTFLDKRDLALTGMFYTNQEDKVKCYFCEVEIGRWEENDHFVSEHLRWSPNCPLLRRRTTNNVPINADALDRVLPPISYDICGSNDALEIRPNSIPEGPQTLPVASTFSPALQLGSHLAPRTIAAIQEPCSRPAAATNGGNYYPEYPEYAIESARLRSFEHWPRNMKQKPAQLAEAGFFYTAVGDRVRCFSCGGGLKDWNDNDEPWEQHALWLSHCRFVKLIKGQQYIDGVAAAAAAAASSSSQPEIETQNSNNDLSQKELHLDSRSNSATPSSETSATPAAPVAASLEAAPANGAESDVAPTVPVAAAVKLVAEEAGTGKSASAIPEEKLCKICYGAEYNTAFLPCGHVVACAKCASSVTKCPLCRKPFTDVMRVYFS